MLEETIYLEITHRHKKYREHMNTLQIKGKMHFTAVYFLTPILHDDARIHTLGPPNLMK